jgi:periplasmic divalent cation tolerance protein
MPPPEASLVPELRLIVTTFAKESDATGTIRTLLSEELIACGTLLHRARSIYIWKDQIEDAEEIVVVLKTAACVAGRVASRLRELHPYEVPEILTFTPEAADAAYAHWVKKSCSGDVQWDRSRSDSPSTS